MAERDGTPVGMAITNPGRDADGGTSTAELRALYVDPGAQRSGVGRALLATAISDLRDRGFDRAMLWVMNANATARRFYEAVGWRPDAMTSTAEERGVTFNLLRYSLDLSA